MAAVAPVAGVPSLNPVTAGIPGYALQQLQAQRRMQMAQALTQQALTPIDFDPKGHISWTQGLAKALSAMAGGSMFDKSAAQEAALQTQGMQAMGPSYGFPAAGSAAPPATSAPAGPTPQALAAALDPRASAALSQGAQQGSVGPTVANGALMDSMPPAPPAAAAPPMQQPQGAQPPTSGPPLNPFNAPPMLAWMASQGDPGAQEQLKTWLANRATTNEQKNWAAQNVDPTQLAGGTVLAGQRAGMTDLEKLQDARSRAPAGSPQAAQLDAAIAKANYQAPIEVKAGNLTMTPDGKTPLAYNPGLDRGINPTWSTSPQGYTTATGAAPVAGYAPAAASIVSADQRARQENTLTTVPDAGGAQHTVWGNGQAFGAGAPLPPSTATPQFNLQGNPAQQIGILSDIAANHQDPAVRAAAGQRIAQIASGGQQSSAPGAPPASAQPQLGVGPSLTDTDIQKNAGSAISNAPTQVTQSRSAVNGLEQALKIVNGGQESGAGVAQSVNVKALLNNFKIPLGANDVENYQLLQKYLTNSLNTAAAGSNLGGSDARFESLAHGNPDATTMNAPALDHAIRYVLSQQDAAIARGNVLTQAYSQAKAQGDPNAALTAQQQWAKVYNPEYFRIGRLAPADQAQAVNALAPADAQRFMAWRKAIGAFQ